MSPAAGMRASDDRRAFSFVPPASALSMACAGAAAALEGFFRGAGFSSGIGCGSIWAGTSGVSSGAVMGLLAMYLLLALAVYTLTAFEAYRMAQGGGPIVSSRGLLWGAVSLGIVSVLMATMIIVPAARS